MSVAITLLIENQPAPPEILDSLRQVEVEQRADGAGLFRLRIALTADGEGGYTPLDDEVFKPLTPVTIRLSLGDGAQTLIVGYVSHTRVEFETEPLLEVVGMDATATQMNLTEKIRPWPNMADSDIASTILGEYSLTPQVTATKLVRKADEVTVIQRGTDIRFLRQLASRNGFQCMIEYQPGSDVAQAYFGPPRAEAEPQAVLSVQMGTASNVARFAIAQDWLAPAGAQGLLLPVETGKEEQAEATKPEVKPMGKESTLKALEQSLLLLSQTGATLGDELQPLAQASADRSAWSVTAEGSLDPQRLGAILAAGRPVLVRGVGQRYSGAYLVDQVRHDWAPSGVMTHFQLRRNATGLQGNEVFS